MSDQAMQADSATGIDSHSETAQTTSPALRLALRLTLVALLLAALIFVPAGTTNFWQGWAFLLASLLPAALVVVIRARADPGLFASRFEGVEPIAAQARLVRWAMLFSCAALLLPGLDFRLGWSQGFNASVPHWLSVLADVFVLTGVFFLGWVVNVNRFSARTIRVQPGQTVIATGPYCLVRHPIYAGALLLWLSVPLALGSWVAWPAFALLIPFCVLRLLNEEHVLRKQLPGYRAYCKKTPFRLLPWVW